MIRFCWPLFLWGGNACKNFSSFVVRTGKSIKHEIYIILHARFTTEASTKTLASVNHMHTQNRNEYYEKINNKQPPPCLSLT